MNPAAKPGGEALAEGGPNGWDGRMTRHPRPFRFAACRRPTNYRTPPRTFTDCRRGSRRTPLAGIRESYTWRRHGRRVATRRAARAPCDRQSPGGPTAGRFPADVPEIIPGRPGTPRGTPPRPDHVMPAGPTTALDEHRRGPFRALRAAPRWRAGSDAGVLPPAPSTLRCCVDRRAPRPSASPARYDYRVGPHDNNAISSRASPGSPPPCARPSSPRHPRPSILPVTRRFLVLGESRHPNVSTAARREKPLFRGNNIPDSEGGGRISVVDHLVTHRPWKLRGSPPGRASTWCRPLPNHAPRLPEICVRLRYLPFWVLFSSCFPY